LRAFPGSIRTATGILPDVPVKMDIELIRAGKDPILEALTDNTK